MIKVLAIATLASMGQVLDASPMDVPASLDVRPVVSCVEDSGNVIGTHGIWMSDHDAIAKARAQQARESALQEQAPWLWLVLGIAGGLAVGAGGAWVIMHR